ncbi:ABC transporter permease subunit [Paraburkholderia dipogonis]|uniref:ABC transporter permease subunit n=1 Tax=Paraburkholderia dipogonis TaxID=1211383 RepID=A0A4Y8MJ83_9BURK|nr:ABC transporter permease subunit [Paraburkholderia dipogonis]TFE37530.1 ABC transporter permease subunit [Paraburkholderia dipogonis]
MLIETLQLLYQQGWLTSIFKGSVVTILLGLLGMLLGILVAVPLAITRWRRIPFLSQGVDAFTGVIRSVPGLLVIYLLFFGSVEMVDRVGEFFGFRDGLRSAYSFIMGTISIGAISAAYSIEVLRGALQAIVPGVIEAARALGFTRLTTYRRVIAPLMFRYALGGLNNVWQMTIKDTSLVSVVGLQELMRVSAIAAGITHSPLLFYMIAGFVFLFITWSSQRVFNVLERSLNRGFRR